MKNKSISLAAVVTTLVMSMVLASCNKGGNSLPIKERDYYKVTIFNGYPGGGYTVQTVKNGEKATEPEAPTREGYTFGGWTTDYEGNEPYDFNVVVTENIQIYGQWIRDISSFRVTFKYNSDQEDSAVTVENGAKVAEPTDPERDGYTFTGWYLDALCTEEYDFNKAVEDDLVLYGGWQRSAVSVTFNLNYSGANAPVKINAAFGKAVILPDGIVLERYLYAFDGWYTKAFPSATDTPVDLSAGFNDDVTLYAKWTRAYYEVTYVSGVAGIENQVTTVSVENPVAVPPAFVREGYTLDDKWYKDAELQTEANLSNITDDVILYAKWNINHYTVSFDLNYTGATGTPTDQDITYQGTITRPENPTRDGFTFLGWFVGAGDEAPEFNVATDQITKDTVLYAHWAEASSGKVTITFQYKTGSNTITHATKEIDNGTALGSVNMPADPTFNVTHTANDYMFVGWFNNANMTSPYDPNRIITEDVTIYGRILKRNIFEAELADLTDLNGTGSSVELYEEGMIFGYEKIGAGHNEGADWVSNGWYLAGLYYKGAYVDYEIYSSKDIEDAVLVLRVSSEFKELHYNPMTPDEFGIVLDYEDDFRYELPLLLPNPNTDRENDPDGEKTPFADVIISYHFHLHQGTNYISFEVRNTWDYGSGTFKANAPMIDCFYIFTEEDVTLTMTEYTEFIERKTGGN